jgi:hypothetical protein
MTFAGACHCGTVRAALETSAEPAVRACSCAFCRRHGAHTVSDPAGSLRIEAARTLHRYRFGLETADFLLCPGCGVYVAAVVADGEALRATLNVAGMDVAPLAARDAEPVSYDGESAEARRARRLARWTPTHIVEETAP